MTKGKRPTKRVKNLATKKLTAKQATNVRGGAFEVYLNFKGQKQGAIKK